MGVRCFYLEPTDRVRRKLRRYIDSAKAKCPLPGGYHDASVPIDEVPAVFGEHEEGGGRYLQNCYDAEEFAGDDRWPKACTCGQAFGLDGRWQVFVELIYRRSDTGADVTLREAPPGAIWEAWWLRGVQGFGPGPDGRILMCRCPDGHDWCIDSRASNCTMPDDNTHRCWVRHGEPPNLTVDKNGLTCAAGAGSIQTKNWHGFLRNGELVT